LKQPDFDDLVGADVPPEERARLYRTHELLVQAGPPAELSPEMEAVPWPEDSLQPLFGRRRREHRGRRPVLLAAALATAIFLGFVLGQATTSNTSSIGTPKKTVELHGTALAQNALATLKLGKPDAAGNWPMVLHVSGLPKLERGGYYALYLTKGGKPLVSCGTINVSGATSVRMSAAYVLERFDKDGWVIVRQTPANGFQPNQIVLRATAA
jgi:hypothetical protein